MRARCHCGRAGYGRGLCWGHWTEQRKAEGKTRVKKLPWPEAFWARVDKGEGCWEWQGALTGNGYGSVGFGGRVSVLTHRVAYQLATGIDPGEQCVLHRCDNRRCVRFDHLFLGDRAVNMADMKSKGRGRTADRRGERNNNARFTAQQVVAMRDAAARGLTVRQVAEEQGISYGTAWGILRGKCWKEAAA